MARLPLAACRLPLLVLLVAPSVKPRHCHFELRATSRKAGALKKGPAPIWKEAEHGYANAKGILNNPGLFYFALHGQWSGAELRTSVGILSEGG
jgi:hypothetical protein